MRTSLRVLKFRNFLLSWFVWYPNIKFFSFSPDGCQVTCTNNNFKGIEFVWCNNGAPAPAISRLSVFRVILFRDSQWYTSVAFFFSKTSPEFFKDSQLSFWQRSVATLGIPTTVTNFQKPVKTSYSMDWLKISDKSSAKTLRILTWNFANFMASVAIIIWRFTW